MISHQRQRLTPHSFSPYTILPHLVYFVTRILFFKLHSGLDHCWQLTPIISMQFEVLSMTIYAFITQHPTSLFSIQSRSTIHTCVSFTKPSPRLNSSITSFKKSFLLLTSPSQDKVAVLFIFQIC